MSFGYRLREARKNKNMTQEELAKQLDISLNCLANYERGTSFPKEKYLYRIINILGYDPNYLFQDELGENLGRWLDERRLVENYRKADKRKRDVFSELISIDADNGLGGRLICRDTSIKHLTLDVGDSLYGTLKQECDPRLIKLESRNGRTDYELIISGHGMEPVIYNESVLSIKYADTLENGNVGLFYISGYAILGTDKKGRICDVSGDDVCAKYGVKKALLCGKVIEIHKIITRKYNAD